MTMNRRNFILTAAIAALAPQLARAHHGWSGFDANTPVYLRGKVKDLKWENPHATLSIEEQERHEREERVFR
jgi:hypothetical protein